VFRAFAGFPLLRHTSAPLFPSRCLRTEDPKTPPCQECAVDSFHVDNVKMGIDTAGTYAAEKFARIMAGGASMTGELGRDQPPHPRRIRRAGTNSDERLHR